MIRMEIPVRPRWLTFMGTLGSCIDWLASQQSSDRDTSDAWIYGITGHAFALNIHEGLCPSGPTAWGGPELLSRWAGNLGLRLEAVDTWREQPYFADKQRQAHELVQRSLAAGHPCIIWELGVPEWYVVTGVDKTGYYYSEYPDSRPSGPKPWLELANTGIGWLSAISV